MSVQPKLSRLSTLSTLSVAVALVLVAGAAQAVVLDKGFVAQPYLDTFLSGTTAAARPELAGTVLVDDVQPFSFGGVTGTVQNRVVRETSAGTLDFYWRIVVTGIDRAVTGAPVSNGIEAFRLGNFGYSHITDADWRIDGLGSAPPFTARVFNPASRPDGAVNFLFPDPAVNPQNESRFFFLHTDATAFAKTANYDMLCAPSACISAQFETYAPAVPEPSTYALMALGIGLLAVRRRPRA